jgi:hypothetical protein
VCVCAFKDFYFSSFTQCLYITRAYRLFVYEFWDLFVVVPNAVTAQFKICSPAILHRSKMNLAFCRIPVIEVCLQFFCVLVVL